MMPAARVLPSCLACDSLTLPFGARVCSQAAPSLKYGSRASRSSSGRSSNGAPIHSSPHHPAIPPSSCTLTHIRSSPPHTPLATYSRPSAGPFSRPSGRPLIIQGSTPRKLDTLDTLVRLTGGLEAIFMDILRCTRASAAVGTLPHRTLVPFLTRP